jgi:tripartite-type tricarboxylate transporter receptor subunit TctC
VTGYPGSTDINLALERGEIAGRCGWSWDSLKSRNASWLAEGKINLLVVFAAKRNPEMPPDAPLIVDFVKTEEQRQILNLIMAREILGRPFFGPPGIPGDRAQALRAAFDDTMRDPDFLAEAKKAELEVNPVPAAEVDALLAELYRTPKDVLTKATKAIQ